MSPTLIKSKAQVLALFLSLAASAACGPQDNDFFTLAVLDNGQPVTEGKAILSLFTECRQFSGKPGNVEATGAVDYTPLDERGMTQQTAAFIMPPGVSCESNERLVQFGTITYASEKRTSVQYCARFDLGESDRIVVDIAKDDVYGKYEQEDLSDISCDTGYLTYNGWKN